MAILKKQEENDNLGGSPFLPNTSMPSNQTQSYTAPKQPSNTAGRFTNIQSYLSAANPEKAGQQSGGQQIQSGIQNQQNKNAESIREGIAKSQEQFGGQLDSETKRLNEGSGFVNSMFGAPAPQTTQSALPQSTLPQNQPQQPPPLDITTLSPEQIQQFRDLATGKGSYNQLNGLTGTPDTSKLDQAAKFAGTEGGRYQLLNDTFKRPSYNAGQQKLDQLLLQTQSTAPLQKNLGELARNVGTERTNAMADADLKAKALHTLAGDVSSAANTGVTGAEKTLEDTVNNRATEQGDKYKQLKDYLTQAFGSGVGANQSSAALQLAKDAGLDLKTDVTGLTNQGLDPSSYLKNMDFNASTVASPEEQARASALAKLAGNEQTFLAGKLGDKANIGNILNQSEIGKSTQAARDQYQAQLSPYEQTSQQFAPFDDLKNQIWNKQSEYDQLMQNNVAGIDAMGSPGYDKYGNKTNSGYMNDRSTAYKDIINKSASLGLRPDVVQELLQSEELNPTSQRGSGMHSQLRGLGDVFNMYNSEREANTNKLNELKNAHKTLTLEDLLKRGINMPTQTNTPNASGGKVGIS